MLLQSDAGCIDLLPSLPDAWTNGHISGLRARGNFGVDIRWEKGKLAEATITSDAGETCHVRYADQRMDFPTKKGKRYTLHLCTDDPTLKTRTNVRTEQLKVKGGQTLRLKLQPSGGAAMRFTLSR